MTDRFGAYELRGELGRGAMAVVWRAFDPKLEREVAIKEPTFPPGLSAELISEMEDRFVREGKAAAGLNHPGIVSIYSSEMCEGRAGIVMELIRGATLRQRLQAGLPPPDVAFSIIDQLLDAIAYAHKAGVVHRDVKPENVFFTDEGRVKLTDFGIAHLVSDSKMTQAGQVMGTPGYMAPEQILGQPVDDRTDLFAVGVIAYELITGHNPFGASDGAAPTTVMYRIVHEPTPDPRTLTLPTAVPDHIAQTVLTATMKDPTARFADARMMRAAWCGRGPATIVTAGVPAAAAPAAATSAAGTLVRGPEGATMAPAVPGPGAAPTVAAGVAAAPGSPALSAAAPAPKRSIIPWLIAGAGAFVIVMALVGGTFLAITQGWFSPGGGGGKTTRGGTTGGGTTKDGGTAGGKTTGGTTTSDTYSEARSFEILMANYQRIDRWDGAIGKLAARFNLEDPETDKVSAGVTAQAKTVKDGIIADRQKLAALEPKIHPNNRTQLSSLLGLYGLLDTRADAIYQACLASPGQDIYAHLDQGHDARVTYDARYPGARPVR